MNLGRSAIPNGVTKIIFPYNAIDLGDGEMFLEWMEAGEPTADVFSVPDSADVTALLTIVSGNKNIQTGVVAGSSNLQAQPSVTTTVDETPEPLTDAFLTSFKFTIAETDYEASITGLAVAVEVPFGTDPSDLDPIATISNRATVSPAFTAGTDYTNPVVYTVTADDGTTEREYTVTVTVAGS